MGRLCCPDSLRLVVNEEEEGLGMRDGGESFEISGKVSVQVGGSGTAWCFSRVSP